MFNESIDSWLKEAAFMCNYSISQNGTSALLTTKSKIERPFNEAWVLWKFRVDLMNDQRDWWC